MNLTKELDKYNLIITKILYQRSKKIIYTNNGKYIVNTNKKSNYKIYEYLRNHKFNNYLNPITDNKDLYEIYPYIDEIEMDDETKYQEIINVLSTLQNKTIKYIETNLDYIKKIYEDGIEKINETIKYYYDMQEEIENEIYMAPGEYLLIRNINLIYISLNEARYHLENWFKIMQENKKKRQVLVNNNISINNFIVEKNSYIINWDKSIFGDPSLDFVSFIKNEYKYIEIESIFEIYQNGFRYTKDEIELLFYNLKLPDKIVFNDDNYINMVNVNNILLYLEKVTKLSLKEYKKDEKT